MLPPPAGLKQEWAFDIISRDTRGRVIVKGGRLMRCQYCGYLDSRVIDSRPTEEGSSIRRRRECLRCGRRFTTYEKIETSPLMVV